MTKWSANARVEPLARSRRNKLRQRPRTHTPFGESPGTFSESGDRAQRSGRLSGAPRCNFVHWSLFGQRGLGRRSRLIGNYKIGRQKCKVPCLSRSESDTPPKSSRLFPLSRHCKREISHGACAWIPTSPIPVSYLSQRDRSAWDSVVSV